MDFSNYDLEKLSRLHLASLGTIIDDISLLNYKSVPQSLVFLLQTTDTLCGVFVLDWIRPIGINQLIKLEQIVNSSNLSMALMVSNQFSTNTRELAQRTAQVTLISRAEIIDALE